MSAISPMILSRFAFTSFALGALFLSSCQKPDRMEITETRQPLPDEPMPKIGLTPAERFPAPDQTTLRALGLASDAPMASGSPPAEAAATPQIKWDVPPHWTDAGEAPMRMLNFKFSSPTNPELQGECYLSATGGQRDTSQPDPDFKATLDNLNRWRGQMGQNPYTLDEAKALAKRSLFGQEATYMDVKGAYKGFGASEGKANWRLVGVVRTNHSEAAPETCMTLTVKMTGPDALVEENLKAFDSFIASLRLEGMASESPNSASGQ